MIFYFHFSLPLFFILGRTLSHFCWRSLTRNWNANVERSFSAVWRHFVSPLWWFNLVAVCHSLSRLQSFISYLSSYPWREKRERNKKRVATDKADLTSCYEYWMRKIISSSGTVELFVIPKHWNLKDMDLYHLSRNL